MSSSLNTISLFTGAGGLDLGFHAAGFSIRLAIENDPLAIQTLRLRDNEQWWSETAIFSLPIEELTTRKILRTAGLRKRKVDMLIGGPPCQPFSKSGYWYSGNAKRLSDPRSDTLGEFLRVLEESLPEVFLLENVPAIAFNEKDEGFQFLLQEVEEINKRNKTRYRVSADQLNSVEYGVPQTRERVFVIGHRGGKSFEFPRPTHTKPIRRGNDKFQSLFENNLLEPYLTAWDAIGHLANQDDSELMPRGKWAGLLSSIPEGENYLHHTSRGDGLPIFGWRTRYWSMLLKLAKRLPSWTLTAQPGPAIGPFHWRSRRLSAAELCALQTFPRNYQIAGGVHDAHRQLGNAVPSAMAEILGLEIRRQFFGDVEAQTRPILIPKRRSDLPPPEIPEAVDSDYLGLVGRHADHPGTGLGPGAQRRASFQDG